MHYSLNQHKLSTEKGSRVLSKTSGSFYVFFEWFAISDLILIRTRLRR